MIFSYKTLTMLCQVLMGGLITSENKEVCIKILRWFLEIFGSAPAVAFTDEDGAWMAAFLFVIENLQEYRRTAHLLCTWHMSNHIRGHCMKVFGKNTQDWKRFIGYWWKMVNDSDTGGPDPEALFVTAFQPWIQMLMTCKSNSDSFNEAYRHVQKTWGLRHKWAGQFTCAWTKYGVRSTQRAESVNSRMNSYLQSSMLMLECCKACVWHMAINDDRDKVTCARLRNQVLRANIPDALRCLQGKVAPFALMQIIHEFNDSVNYVLQPTVMPGLWRVVRTSSIPVVQDSNNDWWACTDSDTQARYTTLENCSCRMLLVMGFGPCRHMAKVSYVITFIGSCWYNNYVITLLSYSYVNDQVITKLFVCPIH